MIPVNELRVGNWVLIDGQTEQFTTVSFDCDEYNFAEPVPLTPEILEKAGLKKVDGYGYKIFGSWLQKQDGIWWYAVNNNFIELQYLHQLQNLYFALTGEELQIEL